MFTYRSLSGYSLTRAEARDRFRAEIFPESERRYFMKFLEMTLEFELGAGGTAAAVLVDSEGTRTRVPRIVP